MTSRALAFRKLPPLKALKGFESTARLQSFRKAAEELCLTHPAISQQIQALEENLKVKLFTREGRHAVLTPEGQRFYPVVRAALEQLIIGSESIRRDSGQPILRVQTYISVSIRWLSHRLPRFRASHPKYQLQLISSVEDQRFDDSNADIGLIFSKGELPSNIHWTPLIQPDLFPVCSPTLIDGKTLNPEQLLNHPLLTITSEAWQWQDWFAAAGITTTEIPQVISVDSTAIALELAMDGEGIALVNGPFADKDLNAGRLIKASEHKVESFGEWGLACRKNRAKEPAIQQFTQWLQQDMNLND
jgi:LysR family transcriptional regulator, glycine cleavage system transcriptional activator